MVQVTISLIDEMRDTIDGGYPAGVRMTNIASLTELYTPQKQLTKSQVPLTIAPAPDLRGSLHLHKHFLNLSSRMSFLVGLC